MSRQYSQIQRLDVINRYFSGDGVNTLSEETGVSRSTIYNWIKAERQVREKRTAEKGAVNFKSYNQLKEHAERLEGMLNILKTCGCAPHDPLPIRLKISEQLYHEGNYSVRMICEALDIPRGTFYNHVLRNKRGESSYEKRKEELRIRIREVYEESNQIFGSPKIAAVLQSEGIKVSKEYVRQLMREMGLESIRKSAKKQYMDEARKTLNVVNREFNVDKPNQVWVSDVTYFKLNNMQFYICVIMDLFARKVIAYRVGKTNSTQLVKSTFKDAY
ncbi:MAG: IS3 family transposase [Oscillospiraceae bacterium]|nr:IS3 family transposase [Oscillospiraceae bacterium]